MERQIVEEGTGVVYGSVFPHTHVPGSRITYADVREAIHEDELLDFPFQFITPLGSVVKSVQEHKGFVMDMKVTIHRIEGQDTLRRYSPGEAWHRLRPSSQCEQGPDTVAQTFQGILQNLSQNTSSPARGCTPSSYNTPPPIPTTSSPRPMLDYVAEPNPDNNINNNNTDDAAAPAIVAPAVAHRLATPESRAAEGNASQQQLQHKRIRKPSVKLQEIAIKTAHDAQSRGITATPALQQQPQQTPPHQQQQQQVPRETPSQPGSANKKARRSGFMAWEEARAAVRSMQMKGYNDWVSWCKAGGRPPTLPASPHMVYKEHWISWPDFLGTNGRSRPAVTAAVKSTPQPPAQSMAAVPVAEPPAGAGAAEPLSTSTHQHMVTTTALSFGDPHSAPKSGQVLRHEAEAVTDPVSVSQQ